MLKLTNENYYSQEADRDYMSYSQYKNFLQCEARAMAKLNGLAREKERCSFVRFLCPRLERGEDAFKAFPSQNPELFTGKGELRANFKHGLVMIDTLKNDPLIQLALYPAKKEQIVTAEFAGCWWKSKLDVLDREGKIVDLKNSRDLYRKSMDSTTVSKKPVTFIQGGTPGQMALYAEIERLDAKRDTYLDLYMVIVTIKTRR